MYRGPEIGHVLTRQPDGSQLLTRLNGDVSTIAFTAHTSLTGLTAVRLEALADESLPNLGPGFGDYGNFTLNSLTLTASPLEGQGRPQAVKLTLAQSTTGAKGGSAWKVDRKQAGRDHTAVFTFDRPVGFPGGTVLRFQLSCPGDSPAAR